MKERDVVNGINDHHHERWQVFKEAIWFLGGVGIIGILVYAILSAPPVNITDVHYTQTGKEEGNVVFHATNTSTHTIQTQLGIVVYAEGYTIPTDTRGTTWFVIGRKHVQLVLPPKQSQTIQVRIDMLPYPFSVKRDVRVFVGKTQHVE